MIYYVSGIPYSDELYHSGIPGMHWGRRRFQYKNGKYTPAGKLRYGIGDGNVAVSDTGTGDKKGYEVSQKMRNDKDVQFWRSEMSRPDTDPSTKKDYQKYISDREAYYRNGNSNGDKHGQLIKPLAKQLGNNNDPAMTLAKAVYDIGSSAARDLGSRAIAEEGGKSISETDPKKSINLKDTIKEVTRDINDIHGAVRYSPFALDNPLSLAGQVNVGDLHHESYWNKTRSELPKGEDEAIINGKLEYYNEGGTVDLYNRPVVSSDKLADAGYNTERGQKSSIFPISTTVGSKDDTGVIVTPILNDGRVIDANVMQYYVNNLRVDENGNIVGPDGDFDFDINDILVSKRDLSDLILTDDRKAFMDKLAASLGGIIEDRIYGWRDLTDRPKPKKKSTQELIQEHADYKAEKLANASPTEKVIRFLLKGYGIHI